MDFLYVAIPLILVGGIIKHFILSSIKNKNIELLMAKYQDIYIIEKQKKKNYDYILEDDNKKILLKIINIPKNSQVTINNVSTWKLQWGGNSSKLGRSYPNERYLHEVIKFIKENYDNQKPIIKIIMLYQSTEKILRYINESELEIITPDKTPHGYKVTTYANFQNDFDTLINIK